jgi:hypothetical protein
MMKPCAKNRKRIAWLALDVLDARQARDLRAHIETCEGCRQYFEEARRLNRALENARPVTDLEATDSFHRAVTRAIKAERRLPLREAVAELFRAASGRWRWALPTLGAVAVALGLFSILLSRPRTAPLPTPAPSAFQAASAPDLKKDPPPTLANYELAASRSLDDLDALLTREANRPQTRFTNYTASMFAIGNPVGN